MACNPYRRDSSWQMIIPGCYLDPAGNAHLFPDEVLAELQRQHPEQGFDVLSQADYQMVVTCFREALLLKLPDAKFQFIRHERSES